MLIDWDIPFNIGIRVLLNSYCDYNCFFCHNEGEEKNGKDIIFSPKEFEEILSAFKKIGSRSVAFSGGEPLLSPKFEDFIRIAIKLFGVKNIYITTNGYSIDRKIDFFKKNKIKRIHISLHSLSSIKYKFITSSSNLKKIIRNIDLLIKNKIEVVLNMMVLKGINFKENELEKILNFCKKKHIRLNLLRIFSKCGENKKYYIGCQEIRKRMKNLGFIEIIPTKVDTFPYTQFKREDLNVRLRDFGPVLKNGESCRDCPYRKGCSEGFYYPRITVGGLLKPCLWRENLSLDLKKSFKNDTLLEDLRLFFGKFNRKEQPWVRLNE